MAASVKDSSKVGVRNTYCFPVIHLVIHLIVKGYQVGQAWFTFCKSMLTTPNHLLVFMCLEMLSRRIVESSSRDQHETDQPVFLWIPLFTLLEVSALFQSSGTSPNHCDCSTAFKSSRLQEHVFT